MVRNYGWNVDKNICEKEIKKLIFDTLKENDNLIILNKLVEKLNNSKVLILKNNNKRRTITQYLKSNNKGIINFAKSLDLIIYEKDRQIYISYNDKNNIFHEIDDWLYINKEKIEK